MKRARIFLAGLLLLLLPSLCFADVEARIRLLDGPGGRRAGDIVAIRDVPHQGWGLGEGLPNYGIIRVTGITLPTVAAYHSRHYEYEPGKRVRSHYRIKLEYIAPADLATLTSTGTLVKTLPQIVAYFTDRTTPGELAASWLIEKKIELAQAWNRLLAWLPPTKARATTTYTEIVDPDNGPGTHRTSLDAWEDALGGTPTGHLVNDDAIAVAQCRNSAGSADIAVATIDGWTTGVNNYILITAYLGYRHAGVFDASKYYLAKSNATIINISEDYVRIDGIQLQLTVTLANSGGGISAYAINAPNNIRLSNLIIAGIISSTGSTIEGIRTADPDITATIYNTIIYNFVSGANQGCAAVSAFNCSTLSLINLTAQGNFYGISRNAGTVTAKNCIVFDNSDDFNGTVTCTTSACDDGDAGTVGPLDGDWTKEFVDANYAVSKDFRLKAGGNCANGGTDNPSGLGYGSTDIAGTTRTSLWDIGAFEAAAATGNPKSLLRFQFFDG